MHAAAPNDNSRRQLPEMDMLERAEMYALRQRMNYLARQNAHMRKVLLHDCEICRIAWCPERERLTEQALGRQRQTLRIPEKEDSDA